MCTPPSASCREMLKRRLRVAACGSGSPAGVRACLFALRMALRSHSRRESKERCLACSRAWLRSSLGPGMAYLLRLRSSFSMRLRMRSGIGSSSKSFLRRFSSSRRSRSARRRASSSAWARAASSASGSAGGAGSGSGMGAKRLRPLRRRAAASASVRPRRVVRYSLALEEPTRRPASSRSAMKAKAASMVDLFPSARSKCSKCG